jgi:ADP-ribose pyrophosphatase YjhB (NUDIX family)
MLTRDFVSTVYIVKDGKILLVFHKKLNMWLPPGGHIDENELPCDAAKREVLEETGLKVELVGNEEILGNGVKKLVHPKVLQLEDIEEGHQHINLVYYGKIIDGNIKINENESTGIRWFSVNDLNKEGLPDNVKVYGRKAIYELNGSSYKQ